MEDTTNNNGSGGQGNDQQPANPNQDPNGRGGQGQEKQPDSVIPNDKLYFQDPNAISNQEQDNNNEDSNEDKFSEEQKRSFHIGQRKTEQSFKERVGMSMDEAVSFIQNSRQQQSQTPPQQTQQPEANTQLHQAINAINEKMDRVKENVESYKDQLKSQQRYQAGIARVSEIEQHIAKNPELAPLKDEILKLSQKPKFEDMSTDILGHIVAAYAGKQPPQSNRQAPNMMASAGNTMQPGQAQNAGLEAVQNAKDVLNDPKMQYASSDQKRIALQESLKKSFGG